VKRAAAVFLAPALFMGAQPARHRPPMGELFMALPEAINGDDGLGPPKERLALASRNVLPEEAPESDRVIVAIKDENGREQNAVVSISDSENP
jgi:hypothetical protein